MIRRHLHSALLMHWLNALCWLFLLGSGFALLSNEAMQPLGGWWPALWSVLVGEATLLRIHIVVGIAWLCLFIAYTTLRMKTVTIPFLKEIFDISPVSDMTWCARKGLWLILGARGMRKLGIDPTLPPQGFYNAGQKLVAIASVACSAMLGLTGILLALSTDTRGLETLVQWALLVHLCCAGLVAVLLPVHIYMAAFAPGERPSLKSMLTGFVPEEFAKHHNPLWYASIRKSEDQEDKTAS